MAEAKRRTARVAEQGKGPWGGRWRGDVWSPVARAGGEQVIARCGQWRRDACPRGSGGFGAPASHVAPRGVRPSPGRRAGPGPTRVCVEKARAFAETAPVLFLRLGLGATPEIWPWVW